MNLMNNEKLRNKCSALLFKLYNIKEKNMKIAGIIAEYNPFHNGHLYHIEQTKKNLKADYTVVVMSGNFVMRGEPALFNKFLRAKSAVTGGADLVIELPVPYALSSAEYFAEGGVRILESLKGIDYLSFGSETGNIEALTAIADKLLCEKTKKAIRENSKAGIPVFSAMAKEFGEEENEILKTPNNILAVNYIKALKKINSSITPYSVKRKMADYNDISANGNFISATGMREYLKAGKDISPYIPEASYSLIKDYEPVFEEEFDKILAYALRIKTSEDFLKYADVSEGLENLLIKSVREVFTVKETAEYLKSKRYAYTRIKRILFNILLDIPKGEREKKPEYARVLGFNEKGKELMSYLNKKSEIPLITNPVREHYEKYHGLSYDLKAADIYSIICGKKGGNLNKILL